MPTFLDPLINALSPRPQYGTVVRDARAQPERSQQPRLRTHVIEKTRAIDSGWSVREEYMEVMRGDVGTLSDEWGLQERRL